MQLEATQCTHTHIHVRIYMHMYTIIPSRVDYITWDLVPSMHVYNIMCLHNAVVHWNNDHTQTVV